MSNKREWSIEHDENTDTLNMWVELKGKKIECGHVAYQRKGKEVYSYIITNTLALHTHLASGSGESQIMKLYRLVYFLLN